MTYTESQKNQMIEKIRRIKDKEVFKLNKKDVCPINVYLLRSPRSITIMDADTDDALMTTYGFYDNDSCLRKMVDGIEEMINDWDRVTKSHFASLGRKLGYDD